MISPRAVRPESLAIAMPLLVSRVLAKRLFRKVNSPRARVFSFYFPGSSRARFFMGFLGRHTDGQLHPSVKYLRPSCCGMCHGL